MTWVTLVDGTTADADEVMNNFYHVAQGDVLPRGGSTFAATSGTYDLGSTSYMWRRLYANEIASTCTVSAGVQFQAGPIIFTAPPIFNTQAFIKLRKIVCEHHLPSGNDPGVISGNYQFLTATTLNTVTCNQIIGATLSSSQITLPAGEYACTFFSPMMPATGYKARTVLWNVTGSTTVALGSIIGAYRTAYSTCFFDTFTLETSSALELRGTSSYPATTVPSNPGQCAFGEPEIYSRVFIYQLS